MSYTPKNIQPKAVEAEVIAPVVEPEIVEEIKENEE